MVNELKDKQKQANMKIEKKENIPIIRMGARDFIKTKSFIDIPESMLSFDGSKLLENIKFNIT